LGLSGQLSVEMNWFNLIGETLIGVASEFWAVILHEVQSLFLIKLAKSRKRREHSEEYIGPKTSIEVQTCSTSTQKAMHAVNSAIVRAQVAKISQMTIV